MIAIGITSGHWSHLGLDSANGATSELGITYSARLHTVDAPMHVVFRDTIVGSREACLIDPTDDDDMVTLAEMERTARAQVEMLV